MRCSAVGNEAGGTVPTYALQRMIWNLSQRGENESDLHFPFWHGAPDSCMSYSNLHQPSENHQPPTISRSQMPKLFERGPARPRSSPRSQLSSARDLGAVSMVATLSIPQLLQEFPSRDCGRVRGSTRKTSSAPSSAPWRLWPSGVLSTFRPCQSDGRRG
jgi:hypothetical protein